MPKVFVPSLRYRKVGTGFEPANDISSAAKYGEIVHLTTPGNSFVNQQALDIIDAEIAKNITAEDYILMVGDLLYLSRALATQGEIMGKIRALRWGAKEGDYVAVELLWGPKKDDYVAVELRWVEDD